MRYQRPDFSFLAPWNEQFLAKYDDCELETPECEFAGCPCAMALLRSWLQSEAADIGSPKTALALTIVDSRRADSLAETNPQSMVNLKRSFSRRIKSAGLKNLRMIGFIDWEIVAGAPLQCLPHLYAFVWADADQQEISQKLRSAFKWGNRVRKPVVVKGVYDFPRWTDYLFKEIREYKFVQDVAHRNPIKLLLKSGA